MDKFLNIISVNLDGYLVDFVKTLIGSGKEPVRITRKTFVGDLIYRLIERVPENCRYLEPVLPNKRQLQLELGWLGNNGELRKNPYSYTYFPLSRQREFESAIQSVFDTVFFNVVEITKEYTDAQYKDLIDKFCERHGIDFARHFDSLKKKHYRARMDNHPVHSSAAKIPLQRSIFD